MANKSQEPMLKTYMRLRFFMKSYRNAVKSIEVAGLMLKSLAKKFFGSANDRIIKSAQVTIDHINSFEEHCRKLTDDELKSKTPQFKQRLNNGETLDSILPEAFAVVKEASDRVLNMRHFDVQLMGGLILHQGKIAEMKTGEGKTLVATAPVYLNALTGHGVHVVTINDYLARRDSSSMGALYNFLGLSVGCITNELDDEARKVAYMADITYGTNNEFGFDYLRDHLKYSINEMTQRPFHYAIVDEVDSILIDEARTPLIISGSISGQSYLYQQIDTTVKKLSAIDMEIDEKYKSVNLTEKGQHSAEAILKKSNIIEENSTLYDLENMTVLHHLNQSLKARHIFKCEVDYIVKDGKVMIIDEFTGRIMEGRRYSDGLHQAIEAKEQLKIQNENQTLASITFQNYFRLYPKLSGMTGTAMTEANEFFDIYKLEVVAIPTHLKVCRIDEEDEIYRTAEEKYEAIQKEIEAAHSNGQPVLVGTVSIEKSELISNLLKKAKIKHNVLNARYHEQEANIIAQAGQIHAITIATNMAGRGTDIMLGGNEQLLMQNITETNNLEEIAAHIKNNREKVLQSGGLLVIGTERHESRRIDNQLRGRSGRQGDVGRTKFYLSLEDDLMRLFGSEKISSMLARLGLKKGEAIIHPWISKSLEKAQKRVEMRNYEMRKSLLKFDNVINEQRKVVYAQRLEIMQSTTLIDTLTEIIEHLTSKIIRKYIPEKAYKEEWNMTELEKEVTRIYGLHLDLQTFAMQDGNAEKELSDLIISNASQQVELKIAICGADHFHRVLCGVFLHSLDQLWRDHLQALDHLREGISLRAYAQQDPLNAYKIEAFKLFQEMLSQLDELIASRCLQLNIASESTKATNYNALHKNKAKIKQEIDQSWGKVSRNEPCPCKSGKKFKHCHGSIA